MPKFDFVGGLLTDEETDVLQLRRADGVMLILRQS